MHRDVRPGPWRHSQTHTLEPRLPRHACPLRTVSRKAITQIPRKTGNWGRHGEWHRCLVNGLVFSIITCTRTRERPLLCFWRSQQPLTDFSPSCYHLERVSPKSVQEAGGGGVSVARAGFLTPVLRVTPPVLCGPPGARGDWESFPSGERHTVPACSLQSA